MDKSTNLKKYESKNPLRRFLLGRFMKKVGEIVANINPEVVLDAGCGEGMIINYLDKTIRRDDDTLDQNKFGSGQVKKMYYGIDISAGAIEEAKKRVLFANLQTGSVYALPYADNFFDLVICSEVLEHLEEPEKALKELKRVSKKYVLLSVPNEPWFRISSLISGKYLKTWGNHPEHVQNWTAGQFVKMVGKYFKVLEITNGFPWIIVLVEK